MSGDLTDLGFKASEHEDAGFTPVPEDEYIAMAMPGDNEHTMACRMATKDLSGELIRLQFQIVDGKFQNRTILNWFNIKNRSSEAQRIGLGQLSSFCRAIGVESPKNVADLLMKKCRIKVKVNGDRNEIKSFKPLHSGPMDAIQPLASPPAASSSTTITENSNPYSSNDVPF